MDKKKINSIKVNKGGCTKKTTIEEPWNGSRTRINSVYTYDVEIVYEDRTWLRTDKTSNEILQLLRSIGHYSFNESYYEDQIFTKVKIVKIIVEPEKCYGEKCSCNFEDNDHFLYNITVIYDDGSILEKQDSNRHFINELLELLEQNHRYTDEYDFSKKEFRKTTKDITKNDDPSPLIKILISPYCCNLSTCVHQVICINNNTIEHYNLSVKEINEMLIEKKCKSFVHNSQYHLMALVNGYFLEFYPITNDIRKIKEIKTIKELGKLRHIEKHLRYNTKVIKETKEFASQKHVKIIYSDGTTEEDIIEEEINEKVEPDNKKIKLK